jgi:flagellar hook-associated protein 1 FlgK
MGLTSSLFIGRTALSASQVALQMTGNNIANAATPGYHRQRITMSPLSGESLGRGVFVGRGVGVEEIKRVVSPALMERIRQSASDEASAGIELDVMAQIESITGELGDADLSSELSRFFNAFSELANNPSGTALRSTVIEQGVTLASRVRSVRTDLINSRTQLEKELEANVRAADGLLGDIAALNGAIVNAEGGQGEEAGLRDQRDALLRQLSDLVDISVVEQGNGAVDVLVDSGPVVLGNVSRGLELDVRSTDDGVEYRVQTRVNSEQIRATSGRIGSMLQQRTEGFDQTIGDLDRVATQLIHHVNRLHSVGRPDAAIRDTTGWLKVTGADQTWPLNDAQNTTMAGLSIGPVHGSLRVVVRDASGNASASTIDIDLDGIDAGGFPGTGDDMSMNDLVGALDAVPNLNAEITPEGKLRIWTDAGYEVSFEEDTSGVLAVFGINSFFEGSDGKDIAVRGALRADPRALAVGASAGGNETALAIAGLRGAKIEGLSGASISEAWQSSVERNAVRTSAAGARLDALSSVRESLENQEMAISGVNLDEESVNLITYQQQYQAAARFISLTDELTQVLLNLI